MEYNDLRDHHGEHKEEKLKLEYEKYTNCPYAKCPQASTCPMFGHPMYCPLFKSQPYAPMMPVSMRNNFYNEEPDSLARQYRMPPFYPGPFYPRPFFYPGPFFPGPFPFFFPFI